MYVQVGILLACEGSVRKIFCGSAGTYSNEWILFANLFSQFIIRISNGLCQISWHFSVHDALTDACADFVKFYAVFYIVQSFEKFMNLFVLSGNIHEITICVSGCSISIWYRHLGCTGQFPKGRRLAPYQTYIGSTQFIEPQYIFVFSFVHHNPPRTHDHKYCS